MIKSKIIGTTVKVAPSLSRHTTTSSVMQEQSDSKIYVPSGYARILLDDTVNEFKSAIKSET